MAKKRKYHHDGYLAKILEIEQSKELIPLAVKALKTRAKEFEAIACRGMSGALIASVLAYELKKPLIIVRKDKDNTHSCYSVEGIENASTYLIVDDFVSSGETANAILEKVSEFSPNAKCIGVFEYNRIYEDRLKLKKYPFKIRLRNKDDREVTSWWNEHELNTFTDNHYSIDMIAS